MFHEWHESVPSKENAVLYELLEGKTSSVVETKPKLFFSVVVFVAVKVLPYIYATSDDFSGEF